MIMDRGLQASARGLEVVKQALKLKGWTQEYLSGIAGCTRQTVSKFLAGKRIEKRIFQGICSELGLKWVELVEAETDGSVDLPPNIDELVETVRINIYDSIQTQCGTMRVLDMVQPIDLNAIYANVNILEKITGRQRLEIQELRQSYSLENYDRFSLGGVQEARIPALYTVDKYAKLMILGKPGAGKTTFLKYIALQCAEGIFKSDLIPLFITLKDFAEVGNQLSLLEYITQLFKSYCIETETKIKKRLWSFALHGSDTTVESLLRHGKFLILLDGLDEVKEVDSKRVLQQIELFSNLFSKNLFAITCRIAAREYTFEKFTEVEIADFDDQQITNFSHQWFQIKKDPIKAENFIKKLQGESGIRELASSPLLLTLICLVFGESGRFPSNRSELYKEGLDVLLKKWDASRNIERDQTYQNLSLKRKEDLLSQIAWDTFEKGNYFFKQKEIERYITQYIRNLPNAKMGEDALQFDSEAILKSIEAQHSLLVERARGIYSFSHLTFHEYFTAYKIVSSANSDILIQELATYVVDKRWREVFLITFEMIENADFLVRTIKNNIDSIISQDDKIQNFLVWVDQKSHAIKSKYKLVAIRAYYFNITRARAFALDLNRALDFARTLDLDLAHALNLDTDLDLTLFRTLDLANALTNNSADILTFARTLDLDHALNRALMYTVNSMELQKLLQQIKYQLPDKFSKNHINLCKWWKINGSVWTAKLRDIVIEHRNIDHDWQFSETQKKLLQQYYNQ